MMDLEIKSKATRLGTRAGQKLYYAYPMKREKLSLEALIAEASAASKLTKVEVETAARAFAEVVCRYLEQGVGIDMGEMGTVMPFAQGKLMNSPEEVTEATLQPAKVIFHPKKNVRTALGNITYRIHRTDEQADNKR